MNHRLFYFRTLSRFLLSPLTLIKEMAPKAAKKLLTFPDSSFVPPVSDRRFWNWAEVVKDSFWEEVEQNRTEADHLSCLLVLLRNF